MAACSFSIPGIAVEFYKNEFTHESKHYELYEKANKLIFDLQLKKFIKSI